MINSTHVTIGFRFKAYNVVYEVKGFFGISTVTLLNTKTESMFAYNIKNIVTNINNGVYKIEPRAKLKLTYVEEL